ncbi:MAG: hypothetical protein K9L59_03020 [Desulfobacterales bacterium]|nr:hypothetical protein [Desulfobacterales bacterium]
MIEKPDNGGRRDGLERRQRNLPIEFRDRRSGGERRCGWDRRSGRDRRSEEGLRKMIGQDRRRAFRSEPLFLKDDLPDIR